MLVRVARLGGPSDGGCGINREGLMGGNIMGGQAVDWWPGGQWGETVCHHLMAVHVVGGQAGWPETVAEDVDGISVD